MIELKTKEDIWYEALLRKDSSFEGQFIVGVKTTGIFCRPSCSARKPKRENTEYFSNIKDALDHGYRPCKVCRPLQPLGEVPQWLRALIKEIESSPERKLKDQDLRDRSLEPARVRRWFKQQHGITFHAYQRSLRINNAFGQIKSGDKVIASAFDNGYESLSGFGDSFKKLVGESPRASMEKNIIHIQRISTPLGPMLAGASEQGICLLEFTDRKMLETQLERLKKYYKSVPLQGSSPFFDQLKQELNEYFNAGRKEFKVALDLRGSEFQLKVWKILQQIPYGVTRSYRDQAIALGDLKAVRAVARANGDNRISIIIPCHRVIGSDGKLVGYGGGLWRKEWLLELESGKKQLKLEI